MTVRKFSVRPVLTLKGRTFKGLRGWSGKPLHPPLTDLPIAAYILAAVFDGISRVGGSQHAWARDRTVRGGGGRHGSFRVVSRVRHGSGYHCL